MSPVRLRLMLHGFAATPRPKGAFGVRQLAAAFGFRFSGSHFPAESLYSKTGNLKRVNGKRGSKLPHRKLRLSQNFAVFTA